jgi:hypothetical protein
MLAKVVANLRAMPSAGRAITAEYPVAAVPLNTTKLAGEFPQYVVLAFDRAGNEF